MINDFPKGNLGQVWTLVWQQA